jgi:hypothetical protein
MGGPFLPLLPEQVAVITGLTVFFIPDRGEFLSSIRFWTAKLVSGNEVIIFYVMIVLGYSQIF